MRTRQKRRILPDTMIQEIGRSVKCQKLNKFINRTPKLSVNKPKALRGDQFPGDPWWLSGHTGTFFPLTVLLRRNLTPQQSPPYFLGTPEICSPQGRGDQFPGDPRWLSGHAGTFFPLTAPSAGHKFVLNPCRKAHRNYSLFTIHYSLSTRPVRRHTAPRHSPPHFPGTPENCSPQGRSHFLGTVPVPAACVWVWHIRRF